MTATDQGNQAASGQTTTTKNEGEQKIAVKKAEDIDEEMEEELAGFQHEQCFGEAVNYI